MQNRKLSAAELIELRNMHWPRFVELGSRYAPNIELCENGRLVVELPDLMRAKWLLDPSQEKPSHDLVVAGCGYVFGQILQEDLKMEWHIIQDQWGEDLALLRTSQEDEPKSTIIFCPFSYVAKREDVMNVEVFADAIQELRQRIYE